MTAWADLVAAALVGTERRPLPGTDPDGVLDRAAAWGIYRRAGAPPVRDLPPARPAPDEQVTVAGPAAAARLADQLDSVADGGLRLALITEWLTVALERGRRVPPESLPDLLDAARRYEGLRPLIAAVGGARVAWLAAQNPEWTDLSAGDQTDWDEGTPRQRAEYVAARRRADPDGGRALLVQEWPTLGPEERQALLPALSEGLGPADEEFLEAALDDRRQDVRAAAASVLAALPGSAYNGRMADRVAAYLRREPDGSVRVAPPAECDAGMRRDGIAVRPPAGWGARAWWLHQVLARAPLDALPGLTPHLLPTMSTVDDWTSTVYRGLARAATTRRSHDWAAVLIDLLADRTEAHDRQLVEALYGALAPAELARRVVAVCGTESGPAPARRLETMLGHLAAPWPDDLSTVLLRWLHAAERAPVRTPVHGICRLGAVRLSPGYADEAGHEVAPGQSLDWMASILRLRRDMIRELWQ